MSFISVFVRENFLSVMSDGRASSGGKLIGIEDHKKFVQVSPRFIVIAGGEDMDSNYRFIEDAGLLIPNDGNLEALAQDVHSELMRHPHLKLFLGLGGLNACGEIDVFFMSAGNQKIQRFTPRAKEFRCTFFNLDSHGLDLNQLLKKFTGQYGNEKPWQCLLAQKAINDAVAAVCPVVNTNTFYSVIQREIAVHGKTGR